MAKTLAIFEVWGVYVAILEPGKAHVFARPVYEIPMTEEVMYKHMLRYYPEKVMLVEGEELDRVCSELNDVAQDQFADWPTVDEVLKRVSKPEAK